MLPFLTSRHAAGAAIVLVLVACSKPKDGGTHAEVLKDQDKNYVAGDEYFQVGEYDAAQREFKVALNHSPDSVPCKGALLAVSMARRNGMGSFDHDYNQLRLQLNKDAFGKLPQDKQLEVQKYVVAWRKDLGDKGIRTESAENLQDVLKAACVELFSVRDKKINIDPTTTMRAAFVLGQSGNAEAIDYEIRQLETNKNSISQLATAHLFELKQYSADKLLKIVKDHESLARKNALLAVNGIRMLDAVKQTFDAFPKLGTERVPETDTRHAIKDSLRNGLTLDRSVIQFGYSLDGSIDAVKWKLRLLNAKKDAENEGSALLLVNGQDEDGTAFRSFPYYLENGELRRLTVLSDGKPTDGGQLPGGNPVSAVGYHQASNSFKVFSPIVDGPKTQYRMMSFELNGNQLKHDSALDTVVNRLYPKMDDAVKNAVAAK